MRYVKLLVAKTMDRSSYYVALGLGCHLYQYRPSHIAHLVLPLYTEDNVRRVNGYLLNWLTARFPSLPIVSQPPYGEKKVCTSPPTPAGAGTPLWRSGDTDAVGHPAPAAFRSTRASAV